MGPTDMACKLRAYYEFVKKQRPHQKLYGVHPIRAVLFESITESRANQLLELASNADGSKAPGLFWFTPSTLLTRNHQIQHASKSKLTPRFLLAPETILQPIWRTAADLGLHSLKDPDNHIERTLVRTGQQQLAFG